MKKEIIKIQKDKNRLEYKGSTSIEMRNLGLFLTDDVGCYSPSFKEWALDESQISYGGNFSDLVKENGFVFIGDETSEQSDGGPFCKIPLNEFVKILDQWEQFCKTRPKEILITRENGVITMEGKI